ncbi:MAG: response regulator transcription factor [Myxococcales bacterium]|jgi:DNA-binding response OmpR family regulator|nr:response regulator transcription factor [Myxococcales bacterium]
MTEPRRILIVEDDDSIALGLKLNLEAEGYVVQLESDGQRGLRAAQGSEFDLLILDVMLPKLNGFAIVQQLRREGSIVPIVMLSARGAEHDKVLGLELGAEDYITKPFGLAELLARVKAVLRRSEIQRAHRAEERRGRERVLAGRLEINPATREVLKDGVPVGLTATEFDVLWCLVSAEGQVLSRERILAQVWGPDHHGTLRTIDNFLLQLRNKLDDDPAAPKHLLTVRGVGYRFAR